MSDHARNWWHEYQVSPGANREVISLVNKNPWVLDDDHAAGRLLNNVQHYHAQEWFKAGDKDEFHESLMHMAENYGEAHRGVSPLTDRGLI